MKKKIATGCIFLVLICAAAVLWFHKNYVVFDGTVYSRTDSVIKLEGEQLPEPEWFSNLKNPEILDLRDIPIQPADFESIQSVLPNCRILWMVPVGGTHYENSVKEIIVSTLTDTDVDMIRYLSDLEQVDANGCEEYALLQQLESQYPGLDIAYSVRIGDMNLDKNAVSCTLDDAAAQDLVLLSEYLPHLQAIDATACSDYDTLMEVQRKFPNAKMDYCVVLNGVAYSEDTSYLELQDADGDELLENLAYLPDVTKVTFTGVTPDNELMYQLKCRYPDVVMDWEFELFGVQTRSTAVELILNEIPMENTNAVDDAMKYFYNLERVEMCDCGISSEDMDALNQRYPETRFIWMVHIGIGSLRTDAVGAIPYHLHYNLHRPFYDKEAKDFKYCTDLIALDLGHMMVSDLSFLQYMPNLKYLVLGDMELVKDFSYIANLKELVFLEIFQTEFKDVSLLMNMKKLEDLNISWTKLDNPELLKEMTWLKRLWCTSIGTSQEDLKELAAALPNTLVYYKSLHPTEGGWRNSQNYRDMRDTLDMFYMD